MTTSAVSLTVTVPRGMATVRARLPASRIPTSFAQYLDQVYATARATGLPIDGQNIFVYRETDDPQHELDVQFGVGVTAAFAPNGAVTYAELPVGVAATATHWGDYAKLGETHNAVIAWCRENNRKRTGTRWEVYGHWFDDPAKVRTDVYWLLEP
ncbi:MAG TPA: GyrI-like domain-containing protein [Gemmatimonadaceae bacterium]|jgi:effector-binding domain-containing protein